VHKNLSKIENGYAESVFEPFTVTPLPPDTVAGLGVELIEAFGAVGRLTAVWGEPATPRRLSDLWVPARLVEFCPPARTFFPRRACE
jgi:hypothetical protein